MKQCPTSSPPGYPASFGFLRAIGGCFRTGSVSLFHETVREECLQLVTRPPCYAPHGVRVQNERGHPIDGLCFSVLPQYRVTWAWFGDEGRHGEGARGIRTYRGSEGRRGGERRQAEREGDGRKRKGRRTRVVRRGKGGGDFEHAPQPPRFFSPGIEKGDQTMRHMPRGACASCVYATAHARTRARSYFYARSLSAGEVSPANYCFETFIT